MSNIATLVAGIATIAADLRRVRIDPRDLVFHRSRVEPTDPDELRDRNERRTGLAQSWSDQPLSDIIARDGDFAIADGNERVAGLLLLGVTEITVALLPADTPDAELDKISLLTDFHKTTLTPFERATVAKRLLDASGGRKNELAARLRVDPGHLTKLLSLFDCPGDVQEAARAGRIGVAKWYAISLAQRKKADEPTGEEAEPTKSASVKLAISEGASVVVKGADLTLAKVVETLASVLKEAEKAKGHHLSLDSFVRVMADKAKAPVDAAPAKAAKGRKAKEAALAD